MVGLAQSLGLRPLSRMQSVGAAYKRGGGVFVPPAWLLNYDPLQFTKAKADFALTKAGTARSQILAVGESTTRGEWTDPVAGDHWNNIHRGSWPGQLCDILAATKGIQTNREEYYGMGGKLGIVPITANRNSAKPGFNAQAPWFESSSTSMGGTMYQNTTDATPLVIALETPCDTFELFDIQGSGAGTISYNIDGGADVNLVQTNATTAKRRTIIPLGSVGMHTINIKRVSGSAYFRGYKAYNSTVKAIDVINGGTGSALIADINATTVAYTSANEIMDQASRSSLVIVNEQINDELVPTNSVTFKASMTTLITNLKAQGPSVMMMTGNPVNTANVSDVTQQLYRQNCIDVAIANNVCIIDQYMLFTSFATAVANFGAQNALHPNYAWTNSLANSLALVVAGATGL